MKLEKSKKRLSFLNSGRTVKKEAGTQSRGLILGGDVESIVNKFQPQARKRISETIKKSARKYGKDFDRPELVAEIPSMMIEQLRGGNAVSTMKGPGHSSADFQLFGNHCCCHTISTYPLKDNHHMREGDPICDRYFVKLFENRMIGALADGCNWGERTRRAAKKACKAFTLYLNESHRKPKNLQEIAKLMLGGFADAHRKILESASEGVWEAGTTTMNGHMICRASSNGSGDNFKWVFICCNLGDCKAFHYSKQTKKVNDITKNTRFDVRDSGDPGGRLGPREDGQPDLRNLAFYWENCEEGDYIFIVSDGVYDNCDLRHQGFKPADVGLQGDSWNDVDINQAAVVDAAFVEEQLATIINGIQGEVHPQAICSAITDHCFKLTENTRQFMIQNPNCRLPKDYTLYPGKVDHTTVLCYQVAEVTLSYNQWMGK